MNMYENCSRGCDAYPIILYHMPNEQYPLSTPFHWQDDLEILHITNGEITLSLDGKTYQGHAGEVVCINPGQLHSFHSNTPDASCDIFIFPLKHLLFTHEDHDQENLLRPLIEGQYGFPLYLKNSAKQRLLQAIHLQKEQPVAYEMQTKALLLQMIAYISQQNAFILLHSAKKNDTCKEIILYIQQHYAEDLPILRIATAVGISPTYFSTYFTEHFGQTFSAYLCSFRINRACALLKSTSKSIAEIALSVGFGSESHFIRNFRKITGMTPFVYRRRKY